MALRLAARWINLNGCCFTPYKVKFCLIDFNLDGFNSRDRQSAI